MIAESLALRATSMDEAMFDAEHFFDGYKANPDYAIACLKAAPRPARAGWCCATPMAAPCRTRSSASSARSARRSPASSSASIPITTPRTPWPTRLAAVRAGARQVQGTINGLGERCGNANLIALIPNLMLKMGFESGLAPDALSQLTHLSRLLDDRLNRRPTGAPPMSATRAFAHKGGLHVSAVEKDPRTYEHVDPELVGNQRLIVVSDQAGRSNIMARFRQIGLEVDPKHPRRRPPAGDRQGPRGRGLCL